MFDAFAQSLFDYLPDLEGLNADDARRMLSRAYLAVIEIRTGGKQSMRSTEAMNYLRRLASTVEFYAVLDETVESAVKQAGAFISAESLALLADFYDRDHTLEAPGCRLCHNASYARIEAGILYLIAGYDACAAGVVGGIASAGDLPLSTGGLAAEWCLEVLRSLCEFRLNPLPDSSCPVNFIRGTALEGMELEDDTIGRLYGMLGAAVSDFMLWLAGESSEGEAKSDLALEQLLDALGPHAISATWAGVGKDYSRIRHLAALLRACFPYLGRRALVHVVPSGPGFNHDQYLGYLKFRAHGDQPGSIGRPVLWPSAEAYVNSCISGNSKHAVVSMPTGSGKSFVAELAVSQSVGLGWCLYLAPTNALTEQIRNDLRNGLRPLRTEVLAFVGDQEYSVLKTDVVSEMPLNSVAVMTPEKAFLALRLYPDVFASCQLVIFDECQLLGEASSGRGVTAELVLSQLMLRSSEIRILLMSAIVQNPEDLSEWLEEATENSSATIRVPWRPTRTLRSALGVDTESGRNNYQLAVKSLQNRSQTRKNEKFEAFYSLACGLQGAWQSTNDSDYGIVRIECKAALQASRAKQANGEWKYSISADKWVNGSAIRVGAFLAENGIQTLVFTPANKHYPFSNADATILSADCIASLASKPDTIEICRTLSEFEFGLPSDVFSLIDRGLSVHTARMIETEKIASEAAFRAHVTRVMYATGTLAQGLNLPAMAVVIAGTRIGDPRGEEAKVVEQRKLSQLLNAAGRAGRAGFANQGLVIAIPDLPQFLDSYSHVVKLKRQLTYLEQPDNAVEINSGLENFLDQVAKGMLTAEYANEVELQAIAVLTGGDEGQPLPADILRKSYAAFQRRSRGYPDIIDAAAVHLAAIRSAFVDQEHVASWVPIAAQRAGLDFFLTVSLVNAWARVRNPIPPDVLHWSVNEWTEELLRIISHIPPGILFRHYSLDIIGKGSPKLAKIGKDQKFQSIADRNWTVPVEWVEGWFDIKPLLKLWMEGEPLITLASQVTGLPVIEISSRRTAGSQPIPKTLAIVSDLFSSLAILGGGLVAIAEQLFQDFTEKGYSAFANGVPMGLSCMPMCIKYGCDSPGSLSWFRFGVRLRRPSRLLFKAFPPPELNDIRLRDWVRNKKRDLINGTVSLPADLFRENEKVIQALYDFIIRG